MTTMVFTTQTSDAMAKQCATFIAEYCRQVQNPRGCCDDCVFLPHEADAICLLWEELPEKWRIK